MNSFRTDEETRAALRDFPTLAADLPTTFVQHRFPRVRIEDLAPAESPHTPELEAVRAGVADFIPDGLPLGILPEEASLGRPTMGDIARGLDAQVLYGGPDSLTREVHDYKVAAMRLPKDSPEQQAARAAA